MINKERGGNPKGNCDHPKKYNKECDCYCHKINRG